MKIKNFNQYIISSEETVKKAVIKLGKLKKQFCIVVDKKNKYVGTLTDGDIRRSLLLNFTLKNKIEDVCNTKSYFVRKEITENKIQEIFKLKEVPFLPIVSKLKKIIGIHYLSNYKSLDTIENEMLIMAGGKGKRLRPFTNKIPKPLFGCGKAL